MQSPDHVYPTHLSISTETDNGVDGPGSHPVGEVFQGSTGSHVTVLVKLLRQNSPVASEEPETSMELFVRSDETCELEPIKDKVFLTRILPFVSGSLLVFVGNCQREGLTWAESKAMLLAEYYPYFVRERLNREKIAFKFHKEKTLTIYSRFFGLNFWNTRPWKNR
jgi:hypothetical protein